MHGTVLKASAHLHVMFENDSYFSHLSTLERELSFRTEMGLYYSYFKTLVTAPSFLQGLGSIVNDNHTEYPSTINTLQRFNLYPEVILGAVFRTWHAFLDFQGNSGLECFQISRGYGQPPVTACNGLADPACFYISSVFALNGAMASIVFVLGTYLSDNFWGGLVSVIFFFFNHGEATRVMWTPPLRESFAMPFLLLQMLILTSCIRHHSPTLYHYGLLVVASLAFLLPWQFSQFVLVTQSFSLLFLHSLRLVPSNQLACIFLSLGTALFANILLQFCNSLLLTSLLPSSILSCLLVVGSQNICNYIPWKFLRICAEVITALLLTLVFKLVLSLVISGGVDDAHIAAIFVSKITSYRDFHTQLYSCSPEFDFLPLDYPIQVTATLLLPAAIIAIVVVGASLFRHLFSGRVAPKSLKSPSYLPEQTYFVVQCLAFALLAVLIMRLKLLLTPHLCILAALLARVKFQSKVSPHLLVCLLLLGGSFKGFYNIWHQHSIVGEFNDPQLEELVEWVNNPSLPKNAVFAGAMPTMATLRLTTLHPVVNHPHYEHAALRQRTFEVYSVYSRKPSAEIHSKLSQLLVTHVVVEQPWCKKRIRRGCSLAEVWDEEDPINQGKPQFCQMILQTIPDQFKLVFQ